MSERRKHKITTKGKIVIAILAVLVFLLGFNFGNNIVDAIYSGDVNKGENVQNNNQQANTDLNGEQQNSENNIAQNELPVEDETREEPSGYWEESDIAKLDATATGWSFGNNLDDNKRPLSALTAQEKYGKYQADFIKEDTKTIYLTIDEGYENGYTPQILDILKEKDVKAVFFVTMSYAKKNADLVQRMIDEGHIVGNHSVTHPSEGLPSQDLTDQVGEITQLHAYMVENFDYEMDLFRFPAGIYSEQSLALVAQQGYTSVFWSYGYNDWDTNNQPDTKASLDKLTGRLHNGAIYLLHAVSSTNTEILGQFIDNARNAGYIFGVYQ